MKKLLLLILLYFIIGSDTNAQIITTIAGTGVQGFAGDGGPATAAKFNQPIDLAFDRAGNLYIVDGFNRRIRKIDTAGVITTVAGNGGGLHTGDGGQATLASIGTPQGMAFDLAGNMYIADWGNYIVRKVDTLGIISTIAGTGISGYNGDGGLATAAELGHPNDVEVDKKGNVYIADQGDGVIRKIDTAGIISTFAGTGCCNVGDGGPATAAFIGGPTGIRFDSKGNLLMAGWSTNRIRSIDTLGIINTVAGNGTQGFSGDGGLATAAELFYPFNMIADTLGNMFVADFNNNRIRKVDASGIISTIAGTGPQSYGGDGGPATAAQMYSPSSVALDALGNLYIADANNHRIRKITYNQTTNSNGIANNIDLKIYPNPAKDVFKIELDKGLGNSFTLEIYNTLSQLIYKELIVDQNNAVIDLNDPGKGLYIVKIFTKDGSCTRKFLVE